MKEKIYKGRACEWDLVFGRIIIEKSSRTFKSSLQTKSLNFVLELLLRGSIHYENVKNEKVAFNRGSI
jgi:hypothetical protein